MGLARRLAALFFLISAVTGVFGSDAIFRMKGRFGFDLREDRIHQYHFVDEGRKLIIIGLRSLQLWDIRENRLLTRTDHKIPQFAPESFWTLFRPRSSPRWREFVIDAEGTVIVTAERVGTELTNSIVVRRLADLEITHVVRLPDQFSASLLIYDRERNTLDVRAEKQKMVAFATLKMSDFKIREFYSIDEYKWHRRLGGGAKMIVGSGETKIIWGYHEFKMGHTLTLRDMESGKIETEYVAGNVKPETSFIDGFVTADEKYLVAQRDQRVFIWEVDGNGQPLVEISKPTPKSEFDIERIHKERFIVVFIDDELQIFDILRNGQQVLRVSRPSPKEDLDFLQITSKGYAVVQVDAKIHVYDLDDGKLKLAIKSENDPKDTIKLHDISADNKLIAVSDDERVMIYEINGDGNPRFVVRRDSKEERFPDINFFDDQNVVGIIRANRKEKKEPRTEFYDMKTGKLQFTAPFEAYSRAAFSVDGGLLFQVRFDLVHVMNRATRTNFTVRLESYTQTGIFARVDGSSGETIYMDDVYFVPELDLFTSKGLKRTSVYDMKTGRLMQSIPVPADLINPKQESRRVNYRPHYFEPDEPLEVSDDLMLIADDGRVVTLWELK